jgi:outer membrane immunogenic protein
MRVIMVLPLAFASLAAVPARAQDKAFEGPRAAVLLGGDNTDAAPGTDARRGFLYGVQLGHDKNFGNFVLGADADILASEASSFVGPVRSEADRYITLAARAGVKIGGRVLAFARGGLADARVTLTPGGSIARAGFTIGGGVEAVVTGQVFLRGEYRYADYGERLRGQHYLGSVGIRF